jgi:hypothetical protein
LNLASQNACQRDRFGPWRLLREGGPEQKIGALHISQRQRRFVSSFAHDWSIMLRRAREALDTICERR